MSDDDLSEQIDEAFQDVAIGPRVRMSVTFDTEGSLHDTMARVKAACAGLPGADRLAVTDHVDVPVLPDPFDSAITVRRGSGAFDVLTDAFDDRAALTYKVALVVDDGMIKVKVNEDVWSPPLDPGTDPLS